MVKRSNRNKRTKRNGKRGQPVEPKMMVGSSLVLGFPHRLVSKLRYHEAFTISMTSGALNTQIYRWNSTFDPNATGGGHQPLYRDTFAAIYDHYAVISAHAEIKFVNATADTLICGVVTDDDTTPSGNIDTLCEQTTGKHVILPPLTGSLSSHTFNMAWNCEDVLGINPYTSQTYKTAVGSDPSEVSALVCYSASTAGNTVAVNGDIIITYEVLWSELATPTQS